MSLHSRQSGANKWVVYHKPELQGETQKNVGYVIKQTGLRIVRGPGVVTSQFIAYSSRNRKLGTAGTLGGAIKFIESSEKK